MVAQNNKFVLRLSSESVSGVIFLFYFSTWCFMCRCHILVFIDLSRCFLINPSVRPGHVLSKPWFILLRRLFFVGLNITAWNYLVKSGLVVWVRILFTVGFYCYVSIGTSHIPVFFSLVPFNICCQFFWTFVFCQSSVIVHPSSHSTPKYISGGFIIMVGM